MATGGGMLFTVGIDALARLQAFVGRSATHVGALTSFHRQKADDHRTSADPSARSPASVMPTAGSIRRCAVPPIRKAALGVHWRRERRIERWRLNDVVKGTVWRLCDWNAHQRDRSTRSGRDGFRKTAKETLLHSLVRQASPWDPRSCVSQPRIQPRRGSMARPRFASS